MNAYVALSVFVIITLVGFFVLSLRKAWKISHMHLHARMDLYPVPKEGAGRASYGGSYLEEVEWWNKPRAINKVHETTEILKEMIFIKKLFVNQRSLWWVSYALHLGVYVMFGWSILLLISVFWNPAAYAAFVSAIGVIGFVLATFGGILLLVRRMIDRVLRKYTTPLEYANIVFILVVLLTGAFAWLFITSPFEVARHILNLDTVQLAPLVTLHLVLLGLMLLYIPVSKMSHYVGKFFTFHHVLWDNDPNLSGSAVESKLRENADQPSKTHWSYAEVGVSETPKG